MTLDSGIGIQNLYYQVETNLVSKSMKRKAAISYTASNTKRSFSIIHHHFRPNEGSRSVLTSKSIPHHEILRSSAHEPKVLLIGKSVLNYRPTTLQYVHNAYSQINRHQQYNHLSYDSNVKYAIARRPMVKPHLIHRVYLYINVRTGVVRLRDYSGRFNTRLVGVLKRWARIFRRNGRLES